MATIIIKNSTGSGAVPPSLQQGELAINTKDGKLFYGSGSGNIAKEFTGSGGTAFPYTGSARITGSLNVIGTTTITGSLVVSGSTNGLNTTTGTLTKNGQNKVDWQGGVLVTDAGNNSVDWENYALNDSSANPSIDWNNRVLSETSNTYVALDYSNNVYTQTQLYHWAQIPRQVQKSLADGPAYAGQIIQATVGAGVTNYQLVYLDATGVWKSVKAAVGYGADRMLGICVDTAGYVLIEGDIGVSDDHSQGSFVNGASYGAPIYISTTTGEMSTNPPGSGVVRVVGYIYYRSTTDTNWWAMKFRPSNDWYVI